MNYQLVWNGSPDIECMLGGDRFDIDAAESDANMHIGFFETSSQGALHCRHTEVQYGQWSPPIPVSEPSVVEGFLIGAAMALLYFSLWNGK